MKPVNHSFYAVIFIRTGGAFEEKIAIGMMMVSFYTGIIQFSDAKVEWVKELFSEAKQDILRQMMLQLKLTLKSFVFSDRFDFEAFHQWFEPLQKSGQNFIGFTTLYQVEYTVSEDSFAFLFRSEVEPYIPKYTKVKNKIRQNNFVQVLRYLKDRVSDRLLFNYRFEPQVFPDLIVPISVGFAGQNKTTHQIVTGHWLDFEGDKSSLFVLSQINLLQQTLGIPAVHFVVSPEGQKPEHHNERWGNITQLDYLMFVSVEESERIVDFAISENLSPIIELH